MKKGFFQVVLTLFLTIEVCFSQGIVELNGINFRQKGDVSELELVLEDNRVAADLKPIKEDKQIILDLKGVKASAKVLRGFDTSEFSGAVVYVSAYPRPGSPNDLRLAVQLRDNVRSILKRRNDKLVLEIENRFGAFNYDKITKARVSAVTDRNSVTSSRIQVPKSESVEDILENLTLSGTKKYIGEKTTLDVKNLKVEEVLNLIAEASGFNIILTEGIKDLPRLTLRLTNVPWDQALDTVLGLHNLVAEKNGNILMIKTLEQATAERKREVEAKALSEEREDLVTKVFPISYASIEELQDVLKEYLTPERGKLNSDLRTNSLIVKDTPATIEKIRKIVELLDTQTPQVLIESKIVEVNESYARELGFNNGLTFGYDPVGATASAAGSIGATTGTDVDFGPGFSFSSAPSPGGSTIGLAIGQFGRLFGLDFQLQLMESESKGKVLTSTKLVTQNKKKATFKGSKNAYYQRSIGVGEDTQVTFEEITADLVFEVTPQVTNEGSIAMEISFQKSDFTTNTNSTSGAPPTKVGSDVTTTTLVDNGSTVVIGGLYEYSKSENHSGVPILKDLPLIGWLFRTPYNPSTSKREVIIFITPRIVNQEQAGLVSR